MTLPPTCRGGWAELLTRNPGLPVPTTQEELQRQHAEHYRVLTSRPLAEYDWPAEMIADWPAEGGPRSWDLLNMVFRMATSRGTSISLSTCILLRANDYTPTQIADILKVFGKINPNTGTLCPAFPTPIGPIIICNTALHTKLRTI